ncbi:MAG: alpha/beta hydrolase [Fimbriimonadaceae bacterium]|nr:alpha/beta hydrolase [Alphaproteobacteria bacterium]
MTRLRLVRFFVVIFFAGVIAGISDVPRLSAQEQRTYILVHGAWVGEWYWNPLVERLRAAGHDVFPVSLRGHGRKSSLAAPNISLSDHATDISEIIEENDLTNIYLVSHSYGGKPATMAWDQNRERIHHVVFVDSFAPLGTGPEVIPGQEKLLEFIAKNFPDIAISGMMPVRSQMRQELKDRATPQSLKTLVDPVLLENGPLPLDTLRTYIVATGNENSQFKTIAMQLRADSAWTVLELASDHDVMKEAADELADILIQLQ